MRSLPAWFTGCIVGFVAVLLVIAYEADPPMAYLLGGLIVAYILVAGIAGRRAESAESREQRPRP